jgi:hypothetical protein
MKKELPVYEVLIDEDLKDNTQVSAVAFVEHPAFQKNFIAFSEQANGISLSFSMALAATSEEEQKVFGPLILANTPVYRKPPQTPEECYVTFSRDTIDKIAQKFFRKNNQASVNINHDKSQFVEDVVMFQSWIVNRSLGIMPMKGFEDAPDGSWFGAFKVYNPEVWEKVKSGEVNGFSIEGLLGTAPIADISEEEFFSQLRDLLS